MKTTKKAILYLHVTSKTKRWLKALCREAEGHVSQSAMAERIFKKAQNGQQTHSTSRH